jgi:hypothetical protein
MLALSSVWIALGTLLLAVTMLAYRPAFTDGTVTLVLYFGSPGAMCLAGLVLWAHRKESSGDEGLRARRVQAKTAIALALLAAAIVYGLVMNAQTRDLRTALDISNTVDNDPRGATSDASRSCRLHPEDVPVRVAPGRPV